MIFSIFNTPERLNRLRYFLLDYLEKNPGVYPNAEPAEYMVANALNGVAIGSINAMADIIHDGYGLSLKTMKKISPIKSKKINPNNVYFHDDGWFFPKASYAIERRCQLDIDIKNSTPEQIGNCLINNFRTFEEHSYNVLGKHGLTNNINSLVMLYGLKDCGTYAEYCFVLYAEPYHIHSINKWKFKSNGKEVIGYKDDLVLYSWDSVSTRCLKYYRLPQDYIYFSLHVKKPEFILNEDIIYNALVNQPLPREFR